MKKLNNKQSGQTLIETALILFLILLVLLGISEFSRTWFVKNSLKNAARSGARRAVVTPSVTSAICPLSSGIILCPTSRVFASCPDSGIVTYVCTSPGVESADAEVSICYNDETGGTAGLLDKGDTVNVCIRRNNFRSIVPGFFRLFIPSQLSADASMRYE